ncbi:hypothetical protein [Clostridium sp.]|uniref:hypothetical protein n=1 Tax=Clostridium sp. TaxID=1506 RepID=UPI001A5CCCC9|nr:hypothetical protein [Clostridium sp.]MBK5241342.1 hypothetical protein [Clostridium sp.]
MKKNIKTVILSILIMVTIFIIVRGSTILYLEFKNIKLPTKESRQIGNMSTHKWITVKQLSEKYNISEEDIFSGLGIIPQNGDVNLRLEGLGKKYNKSLKELSDNLKKLIENNKIKENSIEGNKHE